MHKKKIYMSLLEDSLLEHFPSEFNPTSPHEISNDSTEPENSVNVEDNIYSNTTLNLLDSAAFLFEEDDGACDRANEQLKDILESARQLHADVLALKGAVNGQSSRISELKTDKEAEGDRTLGSLRKSKFKYNNSFDSGLNEKRKENRKSKDETCDFINENMFEITPVLSTPPSYPKKISNENEYLKATSGKDHFSSSSSLLSGEFFTKSSNSERSGDRKFYTDSKSTYTNKPLIEIKPYSEYKPVNDRQPFIPFLDAKPPRPKSNKYESKKNESSRHDLTRNEPSRYESKVSKIINSKILKPTPILYDHKFSRQKSAEILKTKSKTTKKSKKSNESGNSSGSSQPIVVDIELPKLVKIRRYKSATTKHPSSRKSERSKGVASVFEVGSGTTGGAGTSGAGTSGAGTGIGMVGYERHRFSKNKFESRFETNGMERVGNGLQRVGLENYFQNQGRSHTLTNILDEKSSRSKNRDSEKTKLDTEKPKKFVSPGGTTYAEKKINKKKLTKSKSINYSKSSRPELIPIKPSRSPTYKYHKSSTVAKYNFAERGLSLVSSSSDEVSHRPPLVIVSSRKRNDDHF